MWVGALAWAVECVDSVPQVALETEMTTAEEAYMRLDDVVFVDQVNLIAGLQLPCVREAMRPEVISRVHRLMGIHLYALGNDDDAMRAMEASRYAFDHPISDALLPPGHDLRVRYEAATDEPVFKRVPEPRDGSLSFDGMNGRLRPDGLPVIVQFFNSSGMAQETLYLGPREPLPTYRAVPRKRNRLLACTGGAAALALGSLGVGWALRGDIYAAAADPSVSASKLDGMRMSTNVASFTSGLTAGVALGCGVGAVLVGQQ